MEFIEVLLHKLELIDEVLGELGLLKGLLLVLINNFSQLCDLLVVILDVVL